MPLCWVPVRGGRAAERDSQLGCARRRLWRAALRVVQFVLCFLLTCIVVVPLLFVCCSVKTVLIPTHQFLPLFFPFSSALRGGEGRPRGAFLASRSSSQNRDIVPVVHMQNMLGKTVWVCPASGKGKPVRRISFAQGPGCTWWVRQKDGEVLCVPHGDLILGEQSP